MKRAVLLGGAGAAVVAGAVAFAALRPASPPPDALAVSPKAFTAPDTPAMARPSMAAPTRIAPPPIVPPS
ncbi:MAG TPA: hypothetical protein VGE72_01530, partial [Azospirillum sp.]